MDPKVIGCGSVGVICMVQGTYRYRAHVNTFPFHIQVDSGGKVNIFGGVIIGLILNGYRDRAVFISRPNC
jgi:hypothetical protein